MLVCPLLCSHPPQKATCPPRNPLHLSTSLHQQLAYVWGKSRRQGFGNLVRAPVPAALAARLLCTPQEGAMHSIPCILL